MFVSSNTIINNRRQRKPYIYSNYVTQCYYIVIFTFVRWALYKTNCGSFCMNRTTFRDPWPGGVLVKTCIIALRRSTLHGFAASPIAFISHERKQVVIQFLSIILSFTVTCMIRKDFIQSLHHKIWKCANLVTLC